MRLTDIRLQNFRSHREASFELSDTTTIVVGPNGAGKTNLLEAVLLISVGKTYRNDESLVQHDKPWARIDAHTNDNSVRTLKLQNTENPQKTFEIDDKTYKKLPSPYKLPIVLFEPNHLFLLHGEPQLRRNYLDNQIEQLVPEYEKVRSDFKRSLLQRNRLLKQNNGDKTLIFAWNIKLVENAAKIFEQRIKLASEINLTITETYNLLSNMENSIKLIYNTSIPTDNYSAKLLNKLENCYEEDLARGFTSYGPHRDDFNCTIDGERIDQIGSRGETRTLLLALKMIEMKHQERATHKKPTLLLDDVFSELDGAHRKALVGSLKDHQTIITTTDADIVTKNFSQSCHTIPLT